MSLQAVSNYPRVVLYARKSRELGNLASTLGGTKAANALTKKAAVDSLLVGELEKVASSVISRFRYFKDAGAIPSLGKGTLMGVGAAVPLAAGGAYLIDRAGQEEEDRMTNLLAKGSLMAGGIGAGLLGLHQLGKSLESKRRMAEQSHAAGLSAALQDRYSKTSETRGMLFEKSAACYEAITALRKAIDANSSDESLCKKAAEALVVANGHLADLTGDILLGD